MPEVKYCSNITLAQSDRHQWITKNLTHIASVGNSERKIKKLKGMGLGNVTHELS